MFEHPSTIGLSPGFDPAHVASNGAQFSGLPFGGNIVDILRGTKGTPGATAPAAGLGGFGPFTTVSSATTGGMSFSGYSTLNSPSATFGLIGIGNSSTSNRCLIVADGTNGVGGNGFGLRYNAALQISLLIKPAFTAVNITTISIGVPYFICASVSASSSNWAITNLNTGVIVAGSGAGLTSTAPNGGIVLGNFGLSQNTCPDFSYMAAMWSQRFLSKSECMQWAYDPWSFWYPKSKTDPLNFWYPN